ncbi:ankyrin [Ascobolus immersus RN42]|uniref:Ankyrin n=1 Tax=Ascobolus immersus RN42 TaxID=1160509 RepID=A0A3N4I267_ASCIM|nr:ankyrin [Ascobolus immersus RN42]
MAPVVSKLSFILDELSSSPYSVSQVAPMVSCYVACLMGHIFPSIYHWHASRWTCKRVSIRHTGMKSGKFKELPTCHSSSRQSTLLYLLRYLSVFLKLPFAAAGDAGDDLTNNLFSDLAPLLALFGEQVARQYMCHSMSRIESLIFALGPLGIITAITGAIRVGGHTSLRALIGRAREGKGIVELELMSSNSIDVCEMWNGDGISRLLGSGKRAPVIEVFYYAQPESSASNNSDTSSLQPLISKAIAGDRPIVYDLKSAIADKILHVRPFPFTVGAQSDKTHESNEGCESDERLRTLVDAPPNLGINLAQYRLSRNELYIAAFLGIVFQSGVVVFAANVSLHPNIRNNPNLQKEGRAVQKFAFPVFAAGSLLLTVGLFLCAHIVEKSTREMTWEETAKSDPTRALQVLWIQKGAIVNDQNFQSYSLSKNLKGNARLDFTKSRKAENRTLSSLVSMTWAATSLSISGFILQFIGLRNLNWTVSIVQLGITAIMTAVRAALRRNLVLSEVNAKELPEGQEIESVAAHLGHCAPGRLAVGHSSSPLGLGRHCDNHAGTSKELHGFSRARSSMQATATGPDRTTPGPVVVYRSPPIGDESDGLGAQLVETSDAIEVAFQLRQISGWEMTCKETAQRLISCIEFAFNFCASNAEWGLLKAPEASPDVFSWHWTVPIELQLAADGTGTRQEWVVFTISSRGGRAHGREWIDWTLENESRLRLESLLGMAIFHFQAASTCSDGAPSPRRFRCIGTDRPTFNAWIRREGIAGLGDTNDTRPAFIHGAGLDAPKLPNDSAAYLLEEVFDSDTVPESYETIISQVIFTSFFDCLVGYLKTIGGSAFLQLSSRQSKTHITPPMQLGNKALSRLTQGLIDNGLGTFSEVRCCLIPILKNSEKLPAEDFHLLRPLFAEVESEILVNLADGDSGKVESLLLLLLDRTMNAARKPLLDASVRGTAKRNFRPGLECFALLLITYDRIFNNQVTEYHERAESLTCLICERIAIEHLAEGTKEPNATLDLIDRVFASVQDSSEPLWQERLTRFREAATLRHEREAPFFDHESRRHWIGLVGSVSQSCLWLRRYLFPEKSLSITEMDDDRIHSAFLYSTASLVPSPRTFDLLLPSENCCEASTAWFEAVESNSVLATLLLLESDVRHLKSEDYAGKTAIHYVVGRSSAKVILQVLLSSSGIAFEGSGNLLDKADSSGNTPLMIANSKNDGHAVQLLLFYGARHSDELGISCAAQLEQALRAAPSIMTTGPIGSPLGTRFDDHWQLSLYSNKWSIANPKPVVERTLWHWAAWRDSSWLLRYLMTSEHPSVSNFKIHTLSLHTLGRADSSGRTALHYAVGKGSLEFIKFVSNRRLGLPLGKGYLRPTELFSFGRDLFLEATREGQPRELLWHLFGIWNRYDIDQLSRMEIEWGSHSLLCIAVKTNDVDFLQAAIDSGAAVDGVDTSGHTVLQLCVLANSRVHLSMAKILVERGADITRCDRDDLSLLALASHHGWTETVEWFAKSGLDVNSRDRFGRTPLLLACQSGSEDTIRLLISCGAHISCFDYGGRNAMHHIAIPGPEIKGSKSAESVAGLLSLLLEYGDNILNGRDPDTGRTPLSFAAQNRDYSLVKRLLDAGCKADLEDNILRTPLSYAAEYARANVVRLLLEERNLWVSSDDMDMNGKTPMDYAAERGHTGVMEILSQYMEREHKQPSNPDVGLAVLLEADCSRRWARYLSKCEDEGERNHWAGRITV